MTGYGAGTFAGEYGEFAVEIRSVNNRYLDLNLRVPKEFGFLELPLREAARKTIRRGKVDIFVRWVPLASSPPLYEINTALVTHYVTQLHNVAAPTTPANIVIDTTSLLSLPGVLTPTPWTMETDEIQQCALKAFKIALDNFDQSRLAEGKALAEALSEYLQAVEEAVATIEQMKPTIDAALLERLAQRIRSLAQAASVAPDEGRIEMEMALAADKVDVTEELVRLRTHLNALRKILTDDTADTVGKTLDFLVQELHREITTLGNKVRSAELTPAILRAKNEIEKIREQAQNVE
jgi:uncharacterized protein (TIGR00255 family)